MPIYCISTENNPDGVERVLLSFPEGIDLKSALEYVSQNYRCRARPIPLQKTAEVVEIIKQQRPKVVRVPAAEDEDESEAEVDGTPVSFETEEPGDLTIEGGESDPLS